MDYSSTFHPGLHTLSIASTHHGESGHGALKLMLKRSRTKVDAHSKSRCTQRDHAQDPGRVQQWHDRGARCLICDTWTGYPSRQHTSGDERPSLVIVACARNLVHNRAACIDRCPRHLQQWLRSTFPRLDVLHRGNTERAKPRIKRAPVMHLSRDSSMRDTSTWIFLDARRVSRF